MVVLGGVCLVVFVFYELSVFENLIDTNKWNEVTSSSLALVERIVYLMSFVFMAFITFLPYFVLLTSINKINKIKHTPKVQKLSLALSCMLVILPFVIYYKTFEGMEGATGSTSGLVYVIWPIYIAIGVAVIHWVFREGVKDGT